MSLVKILISLVGFLWEIPQTLLFQILHFNILHNDEWVIHMLFFFHSAKHKVDSTIFNSSVQRSRFPFMGPSFESLPDIYSVKVKCKFLQFFSGMKCHHTNLVWYVVYLQQFHFWVSEKFVGEFETPREWKFITCLQFMNKCCTKSC